MKLKEKHYYVFEPLRIVTLPDESLSWLLTHDGDDRYLLPEEYYRDYGIRTGAKMKCRVDKINCAGRVFLEPEHPFYREGTIYSFQYLRTEILQDEAGNELKQLVLKGKRGDEHRCICLNDSMASSPGDEVRVRVVKIRKGKLILEPVGIPEEKLLKEGESYVFRVLDKRENGIWEAEGPGGIRVLLDGSHYIHHGLETGKTFAGYFLKWTEEGLPQVEPEHPVYKPGGIHSFHPIRMELSGHPFEEIHPVWIVKDCYGNEVKVYPGTKRLKEGDLPAEVLCIVERIKNGRPVLRMVDQIPVGGYKGNP